MNHETLQALYALDVAEVGEEEAAKRWEWWYEENPLANYNKCGSWITLLGPVELRDDQHYRRKPGIPWPKAIGPNLTITKNEAGVIVAVTETDSEGQITRIIAESTPQPKQEWPDDAPEWANAAIITWCKSSKELVIQGEQRLIERPKPAVKKIDWSKLHTIVARRYSPSDILLNRHSGWIAWNCDEHTRGNPLPDGLVVEWYGLLNTMRIGQPQDWEFITRFRIVGIQEGWE